MEVKKVLDIVQGAEIVNVSVVSDQWVAGKHEISLQLTLAWNSDEGEHKTPLLSEYAQKWMQQKQKAQKRSTYDRLESTINHQILPYFDEYRLDEVTTEYVQDWIDQLADMYASSTTTKAYQCINAIYTHACLHHVITNNPIDGLVVLPTGSRRACDIVVYSEDECDRLTQICYQSDERNAPLLPFLLHTGLRIGEALALRWSDIDEKNAFVRIRKNVKSVKNRSGNLDEPHYIMLVQNTPKTKSSDRVVTLNQAARQAVSMMPKTGSNNLIFANANNDYLTYSIIRRMLERICKQANIKIRGFHAFRHTFATRLFQSGVDVKTVSSILGHSSVKITYDIYIHSIQEQEAKAVALLLK